MASYLTSVGVQHGFLQVPSGSSSATLTISAVGSRAFISFGGRATNADTSPADAAVRVTLTNSTTVTATRSGSPANNVSVTFTVVDASPELVTSVQFGTVTLTSTQASNTATITAVNANSSALCFLGYSTADTVIAPTTQMPGLTYSGTTVTATVSTAATSTMVVSFCIIEFNSNALQSNVQVFSTSWANTALTATQTISSVTTGNTLLFWGGQRSTALTLYTTSLQRATLTNSTTITLTVNTTGSDTNIYNGTVVEFKSGVLNQSVQRGSITLTGVNSTTVTISSVVTSKTSVVNLGVSADGTAEDRTRVRTPLTNSTTQSANRTVATGNAVVSYQISEWGGTDSVSVPFLLGVG